MFNVIPIGVNGLYATQYSPTSCYLVRAGGKTIVLDLGSGAFSKLFAYVKPENIDLLVLTHFHFDHVSDVGTFGYYMQSYPKKIRLACPCDEEHVRLFGLKDRFDLSFISEGENIDLDGVKISFLKCRHPVTAFAVKIGYGGKTLCYTSDTNVCPNVDEMFSCSDLVVADAAFLHSEWSDKKPHLSTKLVAEYAKKHSVRTLLTHLNPRTEQADVLSESKLITDLCELIVPDKEYDV